MSRLLENVHPRTIVLLYHRVFVPEIDPQLLCVSPEHFRQHLEVVKDGYRTLGLQDAHRQKTSVAKQRHRVVITFDDGYVDNFHKALPLLQKHKIPATVFVATGNVESGREMWWDELERVVLLSSELPDEIQLSIGGIKKKWHIENTTLNTSGDWDVTQPPASERQKLYLELHKLLKPLNFTRREEVLDQLAGIVGQDRAARDGYRLMTSSEISELAADGLVDVGAHTVSHVQLSAQSDEEQRREIKESKSTLESFLGQRIRTFSYPFGSRRDFDARGKEIVERSGFELACSTIRGTFKRSSDAFAVPRFLVRDWDGDVFASKLADWLNR